VSTPRNVMRLFACALLLVAVSAHAKGTDAPAEEKRVVDVAFVEGAIQPISADYLVRRIDQAERDHRQALVICMDTPGGLDTSMRQIVKAILRSEVPVILYVYPSGSRAASAGTFIAYAAHVSAMAPGTAIGAATPVNVGGGDVQKDLARKVQNDAVIVSAGGVLPSDFLRRVGIYVETKYGTA